jgi:hypothetical protein
VLQTFRLIRSGLVLAATIATAAAQQPSGIPSTEPQVKVNVLNVCTPPDADQKEIAAALARIPKQPLFGSDFEISRGRSTLTDAPNFLQPGQSAVMSGDPSVASYVRIRHEFSVQALFSSVQYSFSNDGQNMIETLVLRVRDPKDLMQVSLEDSASAVTSPGDMLAANNPVSRIRLERFGRSSVALARCVAAEGRPAPDQSVYEPLFRSASEVLATYRTLLQVRTTVPQELAKVGTAKAKATSKSTAPKSKLRRPIDDKK